MTAYLLDLLPRRLKAPLQKKIEMIRPNQPKGDQTKHDAWSRSIGIELGRISAPIATAWRFH